MAILPVLVAFPGCTAPVEAPTVSRLTIVQGHSQTGAVGTLLPTQLMLRAIGTNGKPVQGVPISFNVIAGGGTVDPATGTSDANGEVKAKWTLGPASQLQSVAASAPSVEAVILSALGILPSEMIVAQGNNQTAKVSSALTVPLVLRVTGSNNVPIPGQTVALSVASGGGSVTPQSAVTNAQGEVTIRWSLGPTVGLQSVRATSGTIGPVLISATGTP